jgi:integrase/recombinase XerD
MFFFSSIYRENKNMKNLRSGKAEPLTQQQFNKVVTNLPQLHHRVICALCWYTTERPGAIIQLHRDCVYDAKGAPLETIVLGAAIRKDGKTREVPVSDGLRFYLRQYKPPERGYLFPGFSDPTSHITLRAYAKALEGVFLEFNMKGYSSYSTRRGSLTLLASKGVSMRRIQAFSGHASLDSLQRYLEVTPEELKLTADLL